MNETNIIYELISEERRLELEKELKEEIYALENNIISKEKFLYIIKKYKFIEFCYLIQKYIDDTLIKVYRLPDNITIDDSIITEVADEPMYKFTKNTSKYSLHMVRKINRIESMKNKKRHKEKIRKRYK